MKSLFVVLTQIRVYWGSVSENGVIKQLLVNLPYKVTRKSIQRFKP
jgi:hypothetical protein